MSAITKDQILDAVAAMSVLDLSEMIKAMEEKFGVSAAAATVAVAAPAAGLAFRFIFASEAGILAFLNQISPSIIPSFFLV